MPGTLYCPNTVYGHNNTMKIPFTNLAIRSANAPYTDAVIAAMVNSASGAETPNSTAIEEIGAGLWARAFASADLTPDTPGTRALTPDVLAGIGRALVRDGECVYEIDVDAGDVVLRPVADWTVKGGAAPWLYELEEPQPDGNKTRLVEGDRVIHPRYGATATQPWKGIAPLKHAVTSRVFMERLEGRLSDEANGVYRVQLLPGSRSLHRNSYRKT